MPVDYEMSPFQVEFMRRKDEPLVIIQSGVGAGKTRALAFWCTDKAHEGNRILAVAQNYRALSEVLFREIQIVCNTIGIPFKENKSSKTIQIGDGCVYGATGDNPEGILGFTDFNCAVFDEAAYLPLAVYNYTTDRLRGEHVGTPLIRLTSSPNGSAVSPWFANMCRENPSCVIRATLLDNAFTSKEYKLMQIKKYGIGTKLYRQQILGEILESDLEDTLFTREILKIANSRSIGDNSFMDELAVIGLDCARFGNDYTVGVLRIGNDVVSIYRARNTDTGQQADIVRKLSDVCEARNVKLDAVCVDAAYGGGVIDMLRALGYNVYEVNFAEKPSDEHYYNTRAEMYFNALNWCKEGGAFNDEELNADLSAQRYMLDDGGKFRLVPKELIKKTLERSPDTSDAFALTFYSGLLADGINYVKKKSLDNPIEAARLRLQRISKSAHKFDFS